MKELKERLNKIFYSYCFDEKKYSTIDLNNLVLFKTGENKNFKYPADSDEYKLSIENAAISKVFQLGFSMWEANKRNKEVYDTIYTFPSNKEKFKVFEEIDLLTTKKEMIPINGSKKIARNFINAVCNKAIQLNKKKDINSISNSKFFITGDIGIGKTTFLNYIFSTFHDLLHKKNVIWVRVDLTKHYHNIKILKESLEFQISRIYREHYEKDLLEKKEEFIEFIARYFKHLDKNESLRKKEFNDALDDYLSPFDNSRTYHYHPQLQVAVKAFIEKEYGVIYIYDGLDEVRIDDGYDAKLEEVIEILNSEKFVGVYIFVMRFESQYKLLKKFYTRAELNQLSNLRGYGKSFKIISPTLEEIVENRLKLIIKKWKSFIERKSEDIINPDIEDIDLNEKIKELILKFDWIKENTLIDYFTVFKIYLSRALTFEETTIDYENIDINPYEKLENLIGRNYRILLRILEETNTCFLETLELLQINSRRISEIGVNISNKKIGLIAFTNYRKDLNSILRKHYRIVPSLLRRELSYVHPFIYVEMEGKLEKKVVLESSSFPYIYNLFYAINDYNIPTDKYCMLCKIRIMQILKKSKKQHKNLIDGLKRDFLYNDDQIKYSIEELLQGDYIAIKPEEFQNKVIYFLDITQSGLNSLNKLIHDFNYIRIILDDILLPKLFRYDFQDPQPELYEKEKSVWALYQIKRIANFINLIFTIENFEFTSNKRLNPVDWKVSDKMYDTFLDTITKIVHNDDPDLKTIKNIF